MSLNDVCTCCGGYENQPILQLFDNKCFKIVNTSEKGCEFCLGDFAYPVDGHSCIGLNVSSNGGAITVFDNDLDPLNTDPLESEKLYARAALIRIYYPTNDSDGDELQYTDKSVVLRMTNYQGFESEFPVNDVFTIFTNAKSNVQSDLINKIRIINPNLNYEVRVVAMILFGKAQ
jgi:hypothetical protein